MATATAMVKGGDGDGDGGRVSRGGRPLFLLSPHHRTDARPHLPLTVEGTGHSGRSMAGLAQPGCGWPAVIGNCGSARAWAGRPIGWAPPSIAPASAARNLGSSSAQSCWPRLGRSQEGPPTSSTVRCLPRLRKLGCPALGRVALGFPGRVPRVPRVCGAVGWILPAPPGRPLVFHAILQENRLMRCSETCAAPYRSASRP